MKVSDIVALARAGYTAEQISKLSALDNPALEKEETPEPEKKAEPEKKEEKPDPKTFEDLYKEIAEMRKDIIKGALLGASQPEQPKDSADAIIASIINPPKAGERSK